MFAFLINLTNWLNSQDDISIPIGDLNRTFCCRHCRALSTVCITYQRVKLINAERATFRLWPRWATSLPVQLEPGGIDIEVSRPNTVSISNFQRIGVSIEDWIQGLIHSLNVLYSEHNQ